MAVFLDCQRKQFSILTKMHLGPSDIAWVEDLVCIIKVNFLFFL